MKKIMFNDKYGLTQAVLEGRKTMTRRIIPQSVLDKVEEYQLLYYDKTLAKISFEDALVCIIDDDLVKYGYKVEEIVAVAQRYSDIYNEFSWLKLTKGWNNKMFVKAFYMPHQIRITDIFVERLQDISNEDCLKEGIYDTLMDRIYHYRFDNSPRNYMNPQEAFAALIDKVSGNGTWDSNPWVFVYEFELVKVMN